MAREFTGELANEIFIRVCPEASGCSFHNNLEPPVLLRFIFNRLSALNK